MLALVAICSHWWLVTADLQTCLVGLDVVGGNALHKKALQPLIEVTSSLSVASLKLALCD